MIIVLFFTVAETPSVESRFNHGKTQRNGKGNNPLYFRHRSARPSVPLLMTVPWNLVVENEGSYLLQVAKAAKQYKEAEQTRAKRDFNEKQMKQKKTKKGKDGEKNQELTGRTGARSDGAPRKKDFSVPSTLFNFFRGQASSVS